MSVLECPRTAFVGTECTHSRDVGVKCERKLSVLVNCNIVGWAACLIGLTDSIEVGI